jgi:TolB-like protein/Tfp pilus assembly protein PilF
MPWIAFQNRHPDSTPSELETRRHLARIMASKEFTSATRLQQLLEFVVNRRLKGATSIKEIELAMEVFGRRSSFDPTGDAVVRVAASNLRRRLRDYYLGTGRNDNVVIELPKGSYLPEFRAQGRPARALRRRVMAGAALGVLALVAVLYWWMHRPATPGASLAVLPFMYLGGGADAGLLADTFVEEVTTTLAEVNNLRVASRTSAFQFRKTGFDMREAGQRLGVRALLEGSLRLNGRRVRVNAQLIQVSDGFHIWSRTWDEETGNLYRVQQELASDVARALGCRKSRPDAAPKDSESYALYLKGKYFQMRATPQDLARSIELLTSAIARDDTFAPAQTALADSYASLAYHEAAPDAEMIARAKLAVTRALSLDESQAEAHAVLAWIRFFYDWDWKESEQGLRRALALNPNSARTHDWYAQRLMSEGRMTEALRESRRALTLDPLNYRAAANVGIVLYCARRYREAIRQAGQSLDLNPHFYLAHTVAGISLMELGRLDEARAALSAALAGNPAEPDTLAHLAVVERKLGHADAAERLAKQVENPIGGGDPSHYALAYLRLATGRTEDAFAELRRALAQRSSDMPVMAVDPALIPLHGAPQFHSLRRQMGWTK